MKALRLAILVVLLVVVPVSLQAGNDSKPSKVDVCHVPPGNPDNAHVISVSSHAVPAHLRHGDCVEFVVQEDGCACAGDAKASSLSRPVTLPSFKVPPAL